jgi:hypothetical protein
MNSAILVNKIAYFFCVGDGKQVLAHTRQALYH